MTTRSHIEPPNKMTRDSGIDVDADKRIVTKPNDLLELALASIPILPRPPPANLQSKYRVSAKIKADTSSITTKVVYDNTLSVTNSLSDSSVAFYFYPDKSTFVGGNVPDDCFTSCYQSCKLLSPDSAITFTIKRFLGNTSSSTDRPVVFVIAGTAKTSMKPGVKLFPNSAILLNLSDGTASSLRDSTCIMTKPEDSEPSFSRDLGGRGPKAVTPPNPRGAVPIGCVRILTDSSFEGGDSDVPYVGLAMLDPYSENSLLPVFTWLASPGATVNIKPNTAWICAKADAQGVGIPPPGRIIDTNLDPPRIKVDLPDPRINMEVSFLDNKFGSVTIS